MIKKMLLLSFLLLALVSCSQEEKPAEASAEPDLFLRQSIQKTLELGALSQIESQMTITSTKLDQEAILTIDIQSGQIILAQNDQELAFHSNFNIELADKQLGKFQINKWRVVGMPPEIYLKIGESWLETSGIQTDPIKLLPPTLQTGWYRIDLASPTPLGEKIAISTSLKWPDQVLVDLTEIGQQIGQYNLFEEVVYEGQEVLDAQPTYKIRTTHFHGQDIVKLIQDLQSLLVGSQSALPLTTQQEIDLKSFFDDLDAQGRLWIGQEDQYIRKFQYTFTYFGGSTEEPAVLKIDLAGQWQPHPKPQDQPDTKDSNAENPQPWSAIQAPPNSQDIDVITQDETIQKLWQ